jgi:hypothetical protein
MLLTGQVRRRQGGPVKKGQNVSSTRERRGDNDKTPILIEIIRGHTKRFRGLSSKCTIEKGGPVKRQEGVNEKGVILTIHLSIYLIKRGDKRTITFFVLKAMC